MQIFKKLALTASYVSSFPYLPKAKTEEDLWGLAKYLPCVGAIIGLLLALEYFVLSYFQPNPLISGLILTLSWIIYTGGIHLDGLMDTADGIFSHRSQERMLEIMRDSRVGNFGAVSGLCLILVKFSTLSCLPFEYGIAALLLIPAWARWTEVIAIGCFPYLRQEGMGKIWHNSTKCPQDLFIAALIPLLISARIFYFSNQSLALLITASTIASGLAASYYLQKILKGQTGDTYGATVELAEAGGLLLSVLLLNKTA